MLIHVTLKWPKQLPKAAKVYKAAAQSSKSVQTLDIHTPHHSIINTP